MPILSELATKVVDWAAGEKKPIPEKVEIKLEDKELKKYKNWISLADKKHKDDVEKNAKKFMDRLKQKFQDMTEDDEQVVFNYYKSNLSRIIPSLVPKEIKAKIKPAQGKDQITDEQGSVFDNRRAAIILNNKVDKILQDKSFKYAIRASAYDLFVANLGTIVVGYDTDIETKEAVDPAMQAVLDEKAANGESIPGEATNVGMQVTGIKKMPQLTIKRESWRNIKLDPKATDYFFGNKRFEVRVVRKPLEESKVLYGDIEETEVDEETKDEYAKMDEAKMAVFYEVYDYTGEKVRRLTFAGKGTRLVKNVELNYDPLASCKLNYLPDEVYPPCDMTYYESQVDEANFYRTVALNQISRGAARKVLVGDKVLNSDDEDKLMSSKDMELITASLKQGQSLENMVKVLEMNRISPDLYNKQQAISQDIQELSSVNATRLGQVPNAPATNATLANNAYESGMAEKADIFRDWMIQIVERVIAVLKEISVEKEDLVIEHPDGTTEIIKWSNEDIKFADVTVELDITADEPTDQKLARLQSYINFITQSQISSALGSDGYKVQMFEFVKEMSKYFIPDKNFDRFVIKSDLMMAPDRENILIMAGQPVQPQPQENFKEHLEAHNGILQLPFLTQLPQVVPAIQQHIAQTEALMAEQEKLKQAAVPPVQKEGPIAAQVRQASGQ